MDISLYGPQPIVEIADTAVEQNKINAAASIIDTLVANYADTGVLRVSFSQLNAIAQSQSIPLPSKYDNVSWAFHCEFDFLEALNVIGLTIMDVAQYGFKIPDMQSNAENAEAKLTVLQENYLTLQRMGVDCDYTLKCLSQLQKFLVMNPATEQDITALSEYHALLEMLDIYKAIYNLTYAFTVYLNQLPNADNARRSSLADLARGASLTGELGQQLDERLSVYVRELTHVLTTQTIDRGAIVRAGVSGLITHDISKHKVRRSELLSIVMPEPALIDDAELGFAHYLEISGADYITDLISIANYYFSLLAIRLNIPQSGDALAHTFINKDRRINLPKGLDLGSQDMYAIIRTLLLNGLKECDDCGPIEVSQLSLADLQNLSDFPDINYLDIAGDIQNLEAANGPMHIIAVSNEVMTDDSQAGTARLVGFVETAIKYSGIVHNQTEFYRREPNQMENLGHGLLLSSMLVSVAGNGLLRTFVDHSGTNPRVTIVVALPTRDNAFIVN